MIWNVPHPVISFLWIYCLEMKRWCWRIAQFLLLYNETRKQKYHLCIISRCHMIVLWITSHVQSLFIVFPCIKKSSKNILPNVILCSTEEILRWARSLLVFLKWHQWISCYDSTKLSKTRSWQRFSDQAIFSISSTSRSFSLGFPRDFPLFSSSALICSHCGKSTVLTPVDTHDKLLFSLQKIMYFIIIRFFFPFKNQLRVLEQNI